MACNKNHRYLSDYTCLPDSQANTEQDRHKCCGCAYELGLRDGLSGQTRKESLPDTIPVSQAGTVRHKDAMTAYYWGYEEGVRRAT